MLRYKQTLAPFFRASMEPDKNKRKNIMTRIKKITTAAINLLIESDKDSIKSFIVKEHHYYTQIGWVDDYSLDAIERRYKHYQEEGGNSFVHTLMAELRALPHSINK